MIPTIRSREPGTASPLQAPDVGRIVGEGIIREATPAGEIFGEKFGDCFLRKTEIGEAFAIRLANELVCALHRALTLLEAFYLIDQLFRRVRVIAKDGPVGFDGRRA